MWVYFKQYILFDYFGITFGGFFNYDKRGNGPIIFEVPIFIYFPLFFVKMHYKIYGEYIFIVLAILNLKIRLLIN